MGKAKGRKQPVIAGLEGIANSEDRLRHLEMLLSISQQVSVIETLDEVLRVLVRLSVEQTGAERGTLFLNDPQTDELYSRVALGNVSREIRLLNTHGVAGYVYTHGEGVIIPDAYADERFDRTFDKQTGFRTRSMLAAPVRTAKGEVIGVMQMLNRKEGEFTELDLGLLEAITGQAALTLQSHQQAERLQRSRAQELEFLDVVSDVASELELGPLLQKIMGEARRMLKADRATLFLHDDKTNELWSEVGTGLNSTQIRFPDHLGIAGAVFISGKSISIPYAYADLRFNPGFDKKTGYFTRSILCVPVINKQGKAIGAVQALNKTGGIFTTEDETRLRAFSARISLALENAKLFADIQSMKNYNQSMLESMSNGVITLDESGRIITCNRAGFRILGTGPQETLGKGVAEFFTTQNNWLLEKIERVEKTEAVESAVDAELACQGEVRSVNATVLPLFNMEHKRLGTMLMIEDISSEKRMKSTMTRYMDPALADKLLAGGGNIDQGRNAVVTVLFADIRNFTSLTEKLGAQGTVTLLNEYFEIMVECIQREGGMLDKFIGDALMAGFGTLVAHEDDEDRGMRAAIDMIRELEKFNRARTERGEKPIEIGIGLNTDRVVAGPIGSARRQDYTMIGDGVNLAARLESACKQYHARILISEFTMRKLHGKYRLRDIDKVVVKGKSEPVGVYEVLDYHTAETFPNMEAVLEMFGRGLTLYRRGDWDRALQLFEAAYELNKEDRICLVYAERCRKLKAEPPREDWTGVWVLGEK
ncbi:MAG: adenylate cyclase [Verrucomicrobia bacterium]|jgi:adenylate cyclase|nr:adenylate cyclase [Verrucomicrobiota bacterium]